MSGERKITPETINSMKKLKAIIFIIFLSGILYSCSNGKKVKMHSPNLRDSKTNRLLGNNIIEFVGLKTGKVIIDPIDDTAHFKRIDERFYEGDSGKIYLRTKGGEDMRHDSVMLYEYFLDYTAFFDRKTYKRINDSYFANKGKVYFWWMNDSWDYPNEIVGADPNTFIPFEDAVGGKDTKNVFYAFDFPRRFVV